MLDLTRQFTEKDEFALITFWGDRISDPTRTAEHINGIIAMGNQSIYDIFDLVLCTSAYATAHKLYRNFESDYYILPLEEVSYTDGQKNAATYIAHLIENYLAPSVHVVANTAKALRETANGCQLYGAILRAYAVSRAQVLRSPHAGSQCIAVLERVIVGLQMATTSSKNYLPVGMDEQINYLAGTLTVAHATLLHVARQTNNPAPALKLLRNHIVEVGASPSCTVPADYIAFVIEGAMLLCYLHRWAEAADLLYSAVSIVAAGGFGTSLSCKPLGANPPIYRTKAAHMPFMKGFRPPVEEMEEAQTLAIFAVKLCVLVLIIAYGGGEDHVSTIKGTRIDRAKVFTALMYLRSGGAPYESLLQAAHMRQNTTWHRVVNGATKQFLEDRVGPYVVLASQHFPRFIVLSMAKLYEEMYLTDIMAVICEPGEESRINLEEWRRPDEVHHALHLLRAMQRDGQLKCSVRIEDSGRHGDGDSDSAAARRKKRHIVHLSIPEGPANNALCEDDMRESILARVYAVSVLRVQIQGSRTSIGDWEDGTRNL